MNRIIKIKNEVASHFEQENGKKSVNKRNLAQASTKKEDCKQMNEEVVEDDQFVLDVLVYFFGEDDLTTDELTDELRDIAATTVYEAFDKSKALDMVPRPPAGKPGVLWLVSQGVQIAFRKANNRCIYKAIKNTITLKWRSAYQIEVNRIKAGITQSILAQEMSSNNTALVVFIENTGALPFQWESRWGKTVQKALEWVIDYIAEEFEHWLNKFKEAEGKKYKRVIVLEDQKATYSQLKSTLHSLAKEGYLIDVFTLSHGNRKSFSGFNGESITDTKIKDLRNSFGEPLPIRMVYMMNCKGSGLSDDWLYAGAKAVAGSKNNNYIPEPMMTKFWSRWKSGETFKVAIEGAFRDSSNLIKNTIDRVTSLIPFKGDDIKFALEQNIDPLLEDSIPVIAGNSAITIDTAKLALGHSLGLSMGNYSHTKFGTGEHVLTGEVTKMLVKPSYKFDINGVGFTYGELIAIADLFEDYNELKSASRTELERIQKLINKSRKHFEFQIYRKGVSTPDTTTEEWQSATGNRYLELAEDNFAHFAPSNAYFKLGFSSSKTNHQKAWRQYHQKAIDLARKGTNSEDLKEPLIINAFGDHYLTDAFSAGHLFNKDDVNEYFKSKVLTGGKLNSAGEELFSKIAEKAFIGKVKDAFSQYKTVETILFHHPNINSAARFKSLLIAIMEQEPDILGKTLIAKLIHDRLNEYEGGIPVKNGMSERSWNLTGDGTLDIKNLKIIQKAVMQSIQNIYDSVNDSSSSITFFKKVWDHVPQPTVDGKKIILEVINDFTNPSGLKLIDAAAKEIESNYKSLLKELVDRNKLKKEYNSTLEYSQPIEQEY